MAQASAALAPAMDTATEVYSTAVTKATDIASAAIAHPAVAPFVTQVTTSLSPYVSQLKELTQDEVALLVITVLPALFCFFALLRKLFCCCSTGKAKVAPSSPAKANGGAAPAGKRPGKAGKGSANAPAPLETRKSVLARNQKPAPPGSIGHATRGQEVKKGKQTTPATKGKGNAAYMA